MESTFCRGVPLYSASLQHDLVLPLIAQVVVQFSTHESGFILGIWRLALPLEGSKLIAATLTDCLY